MTKNLFVLVGFRPPYIRRSPLGGMASARLPATEPATEERGWLLTPKYAKPSTLRMIVLVEAVSCVSVVGWIIVPLIICRPQWIDLILMMGFAPSPQARRDVQHQHQQRDAEHAFQFVVRQRPQPDTRQPGDDEAFANRCPHTRNGRIHRSLSLAMGGRATNFDPLCQGRARRALLG